MAAYPFQMSLEIWVEAHNVLGTAQSEHVLQNAEWFGKLTLCGPGTFVSACPPAHALVSSVVVKTNPPKDIRVISEKSFPKSLLIRWTPPIHKDYMQLQYEIRLCASGDPTWTDVSLPGEDVPPEGLDSVRGAALMLTLTKTPACVFSAL